MVDGDQVPVIPLVEVPGSVGAVAPSQNAGMGSKSGVTFGLTVMVKVA